MSANPFLGLSPAAVDVLDDMVDKWSDKDRHGELTSEYGYGPKRLEAFNQLSTWVSEAWKVRVNFRDVEGEE